jgi:hypothetical protein
MRAPLVTGTDLVPAVGVEGNQLQRGTAAAERHHLAVLLDGHLAATERGVKADHERSDHRVGLLRILMGAEELSPLIEQHVVQLGLQLDTLGEPKAGAYVIEQRNQGLVPGGAGRCGFAAARFPNCSGLFCRIRSDRVDGTGKAWPRQKPRRRSRREGSSRGPTPSTSMRSASAGAERWTAKEPGRTMSPSSSAISLGMPLSVIRLGAFPSIRHIAPMGVTARGTERWLTQTGRSAYSIERSSVDPEASFTVPSRTSRYSHVPAGIRRKISMRGSWLTRTYSCSEGMR